MLDSDAEKTFQKLVSGLREYAEANGFTKAVVGLSGGIDSSLTACIAIEALGKENVLGLSMPSKFSSKESVTDAQQLAQNLGIKLEVIPINSIYDAFLASLAKPFSNLPFDKTEENLQARIRGNILMAFSNKFGPLVLSTGNKSEFLTGYCTLYGDLLGGLAVIVNVYKTDVYKLANYYNEQKNNEQNSNERENRKHCNEHKAGKQRSEQQSTQIIPQSILEKPPSAELKPNQKDSDALPPYEILDPILKLLVDERKPKQQIVSQGFDEKTVEKVIQLYKKSEFKRRQAPPGIGL